METGPRFKSSSERPEKQGIDLTSPGLVRHCVSLHYRRSYNVVKRIVLYCILLYGIVLYCIALQCSAVQCSAVQCSAVQCSAVQCSAV